MRKVEKVANDNGPVLGRDIMRKIGQGLRAHYDAHLLLDPTPEMAALIAKLPAA